MERYDTNNEEDSDYDHVFTLFADGHQDNDDVNYAGESRCTHTCTSWSANAGANHESECKL